MVEFLCSYLFIYLLIVVKIRYVYLCVHPVAPRTNYNKTKCVKCKSKYPAGKKTPKRVQSVHKYHEVFLAEEMTDYLAGVFSDSLKKLCF